MRPGVAISLERIGKQFYRTWLFRGVTTEINPGDCVALIGTNGSGKSTLMRIIAGQMAPSEGKLSYILEEQAVPATERYQYLSWSAPYLSIFPELTFREHFQLQNSFSSPLAPIGEVIGLLDLQEHERKPMKYYSSGMLQRAKVGLALFQESHLLLLDEPTSNMDDYYSALMLDLIREYRQDRTLILASNLEREYGEISRQIHLGERHVS